MTLTFDWEGTVLQGHVEGDKYKHGGRAQFWFALHKQV